MKRREPVAARHQHCSTLFASTVSRVSIVLTFSLLALNWNILHKEKFIVPLLAGDGISIYTNFVFVASRHRFPNALRLHYLRTLRNGVHRATCKLHVCIAEHIEQRDCSRLECLPRRSSSLIHQAVNYVSDATWQNSFSLLGVAYTTETCSSRKSLSVIYVKKAYRPLFLISIYMYTTRCDSVMRATWKYRTALHSAPRSTSNPC